jgi:8-amino-7-oxononanoate synthase
MHKQHKRILFFTTRQDNFMLEEILAPALAKRKRDNLYRSRLMLESAQVPEVIVSGKKYIAFCSNNYLGLANHPDVISAFQKAASRFGVGSGASHLVAGHSSEHHALEEELAAFTGRDRALLFSTGYMANMGAVTALVGRGDAVFEDRLNHASLLDAGLFSGARFQRFTHNDVENLKHRLQKTDANRKLIVVDGVFSMDGDCAPLPELVQLAQKNNAWVMVDDAHGFGCMGKTGGGTAERYGLTQSDLPILMGTLGKAFGTFGAFVAGSEALVETLIQFSRPYIYTTALPPAVTAATRVSLRLLQSDAWRRDHLNQLISRFRDGAKKLGLQLLDSASPIQPVIIGEESKALALAEALAARGFLIIAIRPPTVAVGSSRLRVTLSAEHKFSHVDDLLSAFADILASMELHSF